MRRAAWACALVALVTFPVTVGEAHPCPDQLRIVGDAYADVWGEPLGVRGGVDPVGCAGTGLAVVAGATVRLVYEAPLGGPKLLASLHFNSTEAMHCVTTSPPPETVLVTLTPRRMVERELDPQQLPPGFRVVRVFDAYASDPIPIPAGAVTVFANLSVPGQRVCALRAV